MAAIDNDIAEAVLNEARNELRSCQNRIHHCVDQLNDEQIWWRTDESFNSIANLLLHLTGNIEQRINSILGGRPDFRDRPAEFSARGPIAKNKLLARFDEVVERADGVLAGLSASQLLETHRFLKLRGEVEGTAVSLIVQTLVHLGGHTQEIVAMTRLQLRDAYRFML
jgi:uncharacterized damage-inducible protein DinB